MPRLLLRPPPLAPVTLVTLVTRAALVGRAGLLVLLASACAAAPHPPRKFLNANWGEYQVLDPGSTTRFGIEYRTDPRDEYVDVHPSFGVSSAGAGTNDYDFDLGRDLWLDRHWVLTPSLGAGIFSEGTHINLGNSLEFRSCLGIAWRFDTDFRLGLGFYHLSNANISRMNPGTEALVLSFSIPVPRVLPRGE